MLFVGNQKIVKLLKRSLEKKKIAQAYIFSGPEEVGKFLLAKIFSQSLTTGLNLSAAVQNTELAPAASNNPDILIVIPEREEKGKKVRLKEIGIERIREVCRILSTYPMQGKYKIMIVNDAHYLTEEAQNSMLKIMEEPNDTSLVILVTHQEKGILPTLQSRCQKLLFSLVPDNEMEKIFSSQNKKKDLSVMAFAMGRPGRAIKLLKEEIKETDFGKKVLAIKNADIVERLKIAEMLSGNSVEAANELRQWIWFLRYEAGKNKKNLVQNYHNIQAIEETLQKISKSGINVRLVLENLLINLFN